MFLHVFFFRRDDIGMGLIYEYKYVVETRRLLNTSDIILPLVSKNIRTVIILNVYVRETITREFTLPKHLH